MMKIITPTRKQAPPWSRKEGIADKKYLQKLHQILAQRALIPISLWKLAGFHHHTTIVFLILL
jgi:hypothetical protein